MSSDLGADAGVARRADASAWHEFARRKGISWRTVVLADLRVLYVQVNKNACTSLKWMMAGIAGEDIAHFVPSMEASTCDFDDIHDRRQWKHTPKINEIDADVLAQIHPDNGWFVFTVLRDPRSRLFSAWQSKLLLDNPGYTSFRSQPWYPRHPASAESVIEDFTAFVALFERRPDHRIRNDGHFRDQVRMLHEDVVSYSHIYDIRELGRLQDDLRAHLHAAGWNGTVQLPKYNDTPLRANADVFADGLRERVEQIYAADFARFGDRWDFTVIERTEPWKPQQLQEVDWRADFGRRIGYFRNEAVGFRTQAAEQAKRASAETKRADALQRRLQQATAAREATPPAPTAAAPASLVRARRTLRRLAGALRRRVAAARRHRRSAE